MDRLTPARRDPSVASKRKDSRDPRDVSQKPVLSIMPDTFLDGIENMVTTNVSYPAQAVRCSRLSPMSIYMSDLGKEQEQILLFCYVVLGNRFTEHPIQCIGYSSPCYAKRPIRRIRTPCHAMLHKPQTQIGSPSGPSAIFTFFLCGLFVPAPLSASRQNSPL